MATFSFARLSEVGGSMNITLRNDGVAVASRERYRLAMRHPAANAPTWAWSENFDSLNDLRHQLMRLGYKLVTMGPAEGGDWRLP